VEGSHWAWSEEYQNWYHDNGDGTFEWASSGDAFGTTGKGKKGKGKRK
jgi:hypothetical protein